MTYIDKCDNDCLDSNKGGYTVHGIAKLGLGEDSMVEGQDAGFDKEQCPWVHELIRIPEAESVVNLLSGQYVSYQCLNVGINMIEASKSALCRLSLLLVAICCVDTDVHTQFPS